MKYDGNLTAKYVVETSVMRPFSLFPWKWLLLSQLRGVPGAGTRDVVPLLLGFP